MWKPLHRQGQGGALKFQEGVEQQVHRRQSRENPAQSVPSSTSQPETLVCMPTTEPDTFVEIFEVTMRRQIGWSSLSSKDTESSGHRKIFSQPVSLSIYTFCIFFLFNFVLWLFFSINSFIFYTFTSSFFNAFIFKYVSFIFSYFYSTFS